MIARVAGLGLAFVAVLAACSPIGVGGVSSITCADIGTGACDEQVAAAAARHPDARGVDVECDGECTRAAGHGTVTIRFADGREVREPFGYTGDPTPLPAPACVGLPADWCREMVADAVDAQPPSLPIRALDARCTAAQCSATSGEAEVVVTFGDGTTATWRTGRRDEPVQ